MNTSLASQRTFRRVALGLVLSLAPAAASAGPTPPPVPAPTNLALSANPANCSSAPLATTKNPTTGTSNTVAQCQSQLASGQAVLATWTWNTWACGMGAGGCTPYNFTLHSGSTASQTWLTYGSTATSFAALAQVSSLTAPCSNLQAAWYDSEIANLVSSGSSNQVCLQLPTPKPTPKPIPVHTPPLKCVAPGEPNPNHVSQCM